MSGAARAQGPWIDLSGRVALVTGAASGIGRAAALALAEVGATVLALDRDLDGAAAVAAAIRADGGDAQARALDVTSAAAWDETVAWIEAGQGRLDILVNSAGVVFRDVVGDPPGDIYRKTFAVNVEGSLLGMAAALGFMRKAGKGSIVNLSSAASFKGASIMASYGASKAAIAHFTKSAALETVRAGHDIRINSVHPGLVETAMATDFYGIFSAIGPRETVVKAMTTGRAGRPEEVADLIVFLASDRSSFISGAEIAVDRAQSA